MSINTILGIVGAVIFITGLAAYLKIKNERLKLAGFGIILVGIILVAIAIVGLPT